MAHFAEIADGVVTRVLVVDNAELGDPEDEQAGIDFLEALLPDSGPWIQTSYNTFGNQHPNGTPLRGNYAGAGYTYDSTNNVFYEPQPYGSWSLSSDWLWEPPTECPGDAEDWRWDEDTVSWVER
tara:strand:+ start:2162 stop:2536 length:375 start_codon:yes stop_codon:yes gene_type:complete